MIVDDQEDDNARRDLSLVMHRPSPRHLGWRADPIATGEVANGTAEVANGRTEIAALKGEVAQLKEALAALKSETERAAVGRQKSGKGKGKQEPTQPCEPGPAPDAGASGHKGCSLSPPSGEQVVAQPKSELATKVENASQPKSELAAKKAEDAQTQSVLASENGWKVCMSYKNRMRMRKRERLVKEGKATDGLST